MLEFMQPRIYAFIQSTNGDNTVNLRYEVHVYLASGVAVGSGMTPGEALSNVGSQVRDSRLALRLNPGEINLA